MNSKTQAHKIQELNKYVAGIDIGSRSHYVAICPELGEEYVKEFGVFTPDLCSAVSWLKSHKITSVAMESTGVYWVPFYEILEQNGIEVLLVNAKHVKNVPGRKSDVLDCQWIQRLHSCGLLRGSFRPEGEYCTLRELMRQRGTLVEEIARYKLRMQKSLIFMNVLLHNVISDITGELGLRIIKEIINGNINPKYLASLKGPKYKVGQEGIEKALSGNYRPEHILKLKQCFKFYEFCHEQLKECDVEIEKVLKKIAPEQDLSQKSISKKRRKNELYFDANNYLNHIVGVDLTKIDGLDTHSVLKILSEVGTDMSKWKTEKHFTSWLGLSPGTKISGGKKLSTRTRQCKNKAAHVFRIAAFTLIRSKSAIGAFLRRKRSQLGMPEAITATAHKLAKVFYLMVSKKMEYKDLGADYYEKKYKERIIKNLARRAKEFGLTLVECSEMMETS